MNYSLRMKRLLVGSAAGAMILATVPTGIAVADVADVCEGAPDNEFDDVADTATHKDRIDCLAAYAITSGVTDTTYEPGSPVLRGQMATFIARFISQAMNGNTTFPTNAPDRFTDDDGTTHEDAINYLADIGVVAGTTATTYSPGANVTRGQMARFIANALDYIGVDLPSNPDDAFDDDDGTTHELQINQLAELQIVTGFNDDTYRPGENVTRAQMATFITGAAGAADEAGEWNGVMVDDTTPPPPGTGVTVRPELVSAAIVSTTTQGQVTPGNPAGTIIRYTFDEAVLTFGTTGPDTDDFYAYTSANQRFQGDNVVGFENDNRSVLIRFTDSDLTATAVAEQLTLATVAEGAVNDVDFRANPAGAAAIGTAQSTPTGAAGVTAAPDVQTISAYRAGATAGLTAVDFTFDQNAWTTGAGGFSLVLIDGDTAPCAGPAAGSSGAAGGSQPGGNGTTTITVQCTNPGGDPTATPPVGGTALSSANVARGVVQPNTVQATSTGGATNPLQVTNTPDQNTPRPELTQAAFQPDVQAGADVVIYQFDTTVTAAAGPFNVYNTDGTSTSSSVATIGGPSNTQVRVVFPDGALNTAVGASANANAVTGANGTNQADEVGVANQSVTERTPGRTSGPNLTAVALSQPEDVFGQPGPTVATYTFDQNVAFTTGANTSFQLYLADGTRLASTSCERVAGATATSTASGLNQVQCEFVGSPTPTSATVGSAVLGTNTFAAVTGTNGQLATEGDAATTGGTGTPAN